MTRAKSADRQTKKTISRGEISPSAKSGEVILATSRAHRTRAKLVVAAKKVFERKGFLESRISDIAKEARVAHGTFYTYFPSKEAAFLAVARDGVDYILSQSLASVETLSSDPVEAIHQAADSLISAYAEQALMLRNLAIVSSFDRDARELRGNLTLSLVDRAELVIGHLQAIGAADQSLDTHALATALGVMVENFASLAIVQQSDLTHERVVAAVTRIWITSTGLATGAPSLKRVPRKR
jgi:AcrR family transcriptional regulator